MSKLGKVYLVGAGPGDAGLMTVRGVELLRAADVVIHDALVNREILRLVREDAEVIYAGKRPGDHVIAQEDLNQVLVAKAKEGKTVVRLKGGDPYIFGRGGEEAGQLAKDGIPFEVVPGISCISSVPNYAGIPITHRDFCSSFTVITGHHTPEGESSIDWQAHAKSPGTLIVLMGVQWIRKIAQELTSAGKPAETPVAMIRNGTMGRQQTVYGTLGNIADLAEETGIKAPAVTVIGGVVGLRENLEWFEKRPLFGKRVVVTRSRKQASQLSSRLVALGADVLEVPTIRFVETTRREELRDALMGLNSYEWLIFTSPNGVEWFFHYFFRAFDDMRDLGGARIAAVGPGTEAKLKELHLKVDVVPEKNTAESIAEALSKYQNFEHVSVLLMRAEDANPELPRKLEEMMAIVDDIACYRTVAETELGAAEIEDFEEHGADWITFTSGSTVRHLNARVDLKSLLKKHPGIRFLSIGPETSMALKELGLEAHMEAAEHNIDGLVESLMDAAAC